MNDGLKYMTMVDATSKQALNQEKVLWLVLLSGGDKLGGADALLPQLGTLFPNRALRPSHESTITLFGHVKAKPVILSTRLSQ
jgi:hypothetical protein